MAVHYRFGCCKDSEILKIDGSHISVRDLKQSIIRLKGIGKKGDVDLQIRHGETKQVYTDENALIAKYSTVHVSRVPIEKPKERSQIWTRTDAPANNGRHEALSKKYVDLASLDIPEEEKIRTIMAQSTLDCSKYMENRRPSQTGQVPPNYVCHRCQQAGHWIKNCTLDLGGKRIKRSRGIPRSFMVAVEGPLVPGAMMTNDGTYAVVAPAQPLVIPTPTTAPPKMPPCSVPDSLTSANETLARAAEQRTFNVPMPYWSSHEYSNSITNDSGRNFQGSRHPKEQRDQRLGKQPSRLRVHLRSRYHPQRRRDLVQL